MIVGSTTTETNSPNASKKSYIYQFHSFKMMFVIDIFRTCKYLQR